MESAADAGEILVSPETASQLPTTVLGQRQGRRDPRPPRAAAEPAAAERSGRARRRVRSSCSCRSALRTRLTGEHDEPEHRHVTVGFVALRCDRRRDRSASARKSSRPGSRSSHVLVEEQAARLRHLPARHRCRGRRRQVHPDRGRARRRRRRRRPHAPHRARHPRRRSAAPGARRRALGPGVRGRRRLTDAPHVHRHGRRGEPRGPLDGARRSGHVRREPSRARRRAHRVRRASRSRRST